MFPYSNVMRLLTIICILAGTVSPCQAEDLNRPAWISPDRWVPVSDTLGVVLIKKPKAGAIAVGSRCAIEHLDAEKQDGRLFEDCDSIFKLLGSASPAEGYIVLRAGQVWVRLDIVNEPKFHRGK